MMMNLNSSLITQPLVTAWYCRLLPSAGKSCSCLATTTPTLVIIMIINYAITSPTLSIIIMIINYATSSPTLSIIITIMIIMITSSTTLFALIPDRLKSSGVRLVSKEARPACTTSC